MRLRRHLKECTQGLSLLALIEANRALISASILHGNAILCYIINVFVKFSHTPASRA